MYALHLHRALRWVVLLGLLLATRPAAAWLETSIRSHVATVDVESNGAATVTHELTLRVRGGPMQSLTLQGVDLDAKPLPNGTVARVRSGSTSTWPLLLQAGEDGSLVIEIDDEKGLRGGVYAFRFSYRTELLERELIQKKSSGVEVRWIGPRFEDGVDSARVIFRLPPSERPPSLPTDGADEGGDGPIVPSDILVTQLRRAADKDELELVRPHLAKGEPAVWRAVVGARAFGALAKPEPSYPSRVATAGRQQPVERAILLGSVAALALLYSALVMLKWLALVRGSRAKLAKPRALIPLPAPLRAVLAGAALAAAAIVALRTEQPTLAGCSLVLAMALATHLSPQSQPALRGPGTWGELDDSVAFRARRERLPGRWLDAGTAPGFLLFVLLLGTAAGAAVYLLPNEPYAALVLALGSAAWLPLFCTGRGAELPMHPVAASQKVLQRISCKLRAAKLRVAAHARTPRGSDEPDELRLLVEPPSRTRGLVALEVATECQHGVGGSVVMPCVIVRALDESPSYYALPRSVVWTRGRTPEERVAVIRPKLPTVGMTVALVRRVVGLLTQPQGGVRKTASGSARTIASGSARTIASGSARTIASGRGSLTDKGVTPAPLPTAM